MVVRAEPRMLALSEAFAQQFQLIEDVLHPLQPLERCQRQVGTQQRPIDIGLQRLNHRDRVRVVSAAERPWRQTT
jgi:hypothetical protein